MTLLTAGCAQRANRDVSIHDAADYQRKLSALTHWEIDAKIAIRHSNASDSAALRWSQQGEHFDVFVSGPLGAGATRLYGTPRQLTIENGKSESTTTEDPDHLMEKALGWELPLTELPRWILGQSPAADAHYHEDHTLAGFTSHHWQVEYLRYTDAGQWRLPEKIRLTHEDLQVTLLIKRWGFP